MCLQDTKQSDEKEGMKSFSVFSPYISHIRVLKTTLSLEAEFDVCIILICKWYMVVSCYGIHHC